MGVRVVDLAVACEVSCRVSAPHEKGDDGSLPPFAEKVMRRVLAGTTSVCFLFVFCCVGAEAWQRAGHK